MITLEKNTLSSEDIEIYNRVIETSPQGVLILDASHEVLYTNRSAVNTLCGTSDEDRLVGRCITEFMDEESMHNILSRLDLLNQEYKVLPPMRVLFQTEHQGGEIRFADCSVAPIHYRGNPSALFVFKDVTEELKQRVIITYHANHDPLTGLLNRHGFNTEIETFLQPAGQGAVLFMDLNQFKRINDTLGHMVGDNLLQVVGKRLRGYLSPQDRIARWGGDEFVVFRHTDDGIRLWAEGLRKSVEEPIHIETNEFYVTASVGIARFPMHGQTLETLLMNADQAMYQAKHQGEGISFYCPVISYPVSTLDMERELHHALEDNGFSLHFQPKVDAASGECIGGETLIRWQHPDRGLIFPDQFIPVAEETGIITLIDEWVFHNALKQVVEWEHLHAKKVHLSINISPVSLMKKPHFVANLGQVIESYGLNPRRIEVEITENVLIQEEARRAVLQLQEAGVVLSLDDFGKGYSALGYLSSLPFDKIKIDRQYIQKCTEGDSHAAIVKAVVELGHALGMRVVAEGVETSRQVEYLRRIGCDSFQGYHFGRPIPGDQFIKTVNHTLP